MRRLAATALIAALCAQPLLADGPLARTITAEAARLAADGIQPSDPAGWRAVQALEPGRSIVLTTATTTGASRTFVAADDHSVTVLNLNLLPESARERLRAAVLEMPDAVADAARGRAKTVNDFVIGPDGLFVRGVKLAERGDVIVRVSAGDVVEISGGLTRHGSAGAATVSAVLALWLVYHFRLLFLESSKGAAIAIGAPIAAGIAGWYANSHESDDVVYPRPATQS